jgi:hypothetical protein
VDAMLLGNREGDLLRGGNRSDRSRARLIGNGSLGTFLEATVGRRLAGDGPLLHVVNIRDWHESGSAYDWERRTFGAHCEKVTWGAQYLEGLGPYLDPGGAPMGAEAQYVQQGTARIYPIHSDSVFDFRPRSGHREDGHRKYRGSVVENVLDVLVQGSPGEVDEMARLLAETGNPDSIHELARRIDEGVVSDPPARVYIAVIGVYTDIKVQSLLVGLRSQYDLPNLAVSDTFTASATLERHLAGLDYAAKVLDVEVIHGINDLVRFLGGPPPLEDESELVGRISFARYRSFFQDKQNVLGYQDEKLRQYLLLTERRAVDVYERIKRANTFLIVFGSIFLVTTLVLAVLAAVWDRVDWQPAAVTGGVGLIQVVSAFVSRPVRELQRNLTNLAAFKIILESHSLKTAFARFHLTTPQTLRQLETEDEAAAAARQIEALRKQVLTVQEFDSADFAELARLTLESVDGREAAAPAEPAPAPSSPRP